jgi:hypothetical protein
MMIVASGFMLVCNFHVVDPETRAIIGKTQQMGCPLECVSVAELMKLPAWYSEALAAAEREAAKGGLDAPSPDR